MKISGYQCDQCASRTTGTPAGWFEILLDEEGTAVHVLRLHPPEPLEGKAKHACGESCAISLISQAMKALPNGEGS